MAAPEQSGQGLGNRTQISSSVKIVVGKCSAGAFKLLQASVGSLPRRGLDRQRQKLLLCSNCCISIRQSQMMCTVQAAVAATCHHMQPKDAQQPTESHPGGKRAVIL